MKLSYELSLENPLELAERLAKPFEKCSLTAYWDCAGYPTNGWGNLLSRNRLATVMAKNNWTLKQADEWLHSTYPKISQDQADDDFIKNLNGAYGSVKRLVKATLTAGQTAALIDFVFNLGAGNLQISTLLRMINRGEVIEAADQFKRWDKAGGVVYRGLTKRCLSRYKLYLNINGHQNA